MYGLYEKRQSTDSTRYIFIEETSLFGCNVGWIPRLLREVIPPNQSEPYTWQIDIIKGLERAGKQHHSLIIDLKPKGKYLSLYELVNVWGYSDNTWTPIMMHLRGLFEEVDRSNVDGKDFTRESKEVVDPIFSLAYLSGSVSSGTLSGRWTTPGQSSTNSVILGTDTFRYFINEANKITQYLSGTPLS